MTDLPAVIEQDGYAYRLAWGPDGLDALVPHVAVVVIVDTLRFTSAVSAALESGATVIPARWADEGAAGVAAERGALLAGRREDGGPSLSPTDLLDAAGRPVPRAAVPERGGDQRARRRARRRRRSWPARSATPRRRPAGLASWRPAGRSGSWPPASAAPRVGCAMPSRTSSAPAPCSPRSTRRVLPAPPCCSPDAAAARAAFVAARPLLVDHLLGSTSGRELAGIGFTDDVHTAAVVDATDVAAQLVDGAFTAV